MRRKASFRSRLLSVTAKHSGFPYSLSSEVRSSNPSRQVKTPVMGLLGENKEAGRAGAGVSLMVHSSLKSEHQLFSLASPTSDQVLSVPEVSKNPLLP